MVPGSSPVGLVCGIARSGPLSVRVPGCIRNAWPRLTITQRPKGATSGRPRGGAAEPSPARVEAFSDGVFAFGVTLLILGIRIPHPTDPDAGAGLLTLLTQQWRSYLVYALSFMFVGNNWVNHRVMFSKFVRTDHALVWLNLVFLMVAGAFIPLPTPVLAAWLGRPGYEVQAPVFYAQTPSL